MPLNNRWTNILPPEADDPVLKYQVRFLARLKPDLSSPDPMLHHPVLRTELAMSLGKLKAQQLPWEWQPVEGSGAMDDGPEPTLTEINYRAMREERDALHAKLASITRQIEGALAYINGSH